MQESTRIRGKWEKKFEGIPICLQCHTQIHRLHKNRELARHLDAVEAVLEDESFAKYLKWAVKLPPETIY
jgi:5-methylcytosine-specific restriction enzyme A